MLREEQIYRYFMMCLAAAIPPLAYFGVEDMLAGRREEALYTFAICGVFALLLVVGILRRNKVPLRLTMALFSFFLLYLVHAGMGEGYGILWAYTFPLASFHLLRNREGFVWAAGFCLAMVFLLLFPGFFGGMVYEGPFIIRFLCVFLIVSLLTYAYAMVRESLHAGMKRELEEKNMLLGEIHHRVNNNLTVVQSILSLGLDQASDEASRIAIMDTESRVRSMSLLHEALYSQNEASRVEVSGYLGEVVRHLSDAYGSHARGAEVSVDIPETWFDVEIAMPFGLIVNELLTNVFKYASPKDSGLRARVSLSSTPEGEYVLSVRDNGMGLPEGFDIKAAGTYGLKIVNAFVDQIKGRLEVVSDPDGSEFRLTFRPPETTVQKTAGS